MPAGNTAHSHHWIGPTGRGLRAGRKLAARGPDRPIDLKRLEQLLRDAKAKAKDGDDALLRDAKAKDGDDDDDDDDGGERPR